MKVCREEFVGYPVTIEGNTERQSGDRLPVLRKKEKISKETCSRSYAMNPGMNSYCAIG